MEYFMTALILFGRILFGGYFLMSGINHFTKGKMMAEYAAAKGVPAARFMVLFSGLFILLGGLGIILGVYVQWAVALLVVFLVPVTYKMHAFWKVTDPMMRMGDMVHFMKNVALLGAALMALAIATPWPFSLF